MRRNLNQLKVMVHCFSRSWDAALDKKEGSESFFHESSFECSTSSEASLCECDDPILKDSVSRYSTLAERGEIRGDREVFLDKEEIER